VSERHGLDAVDPDRDVTAHLDLAAVRTSAARQIRAAARSRLIGA
jgi:hypothetical protein